ncbi:hypothetical protein D3C75_921340 [compost metagenome]
MLKRNLAVDRRELLAHDGAVRMLLQLLFHLSFQFAGSGQHAFNGAELVQQLQCGFLAYARNTWNIIARITHQTLEVDNLLWCQIVFLTDLLRPVQLHFGNAFAHQCHSSMLRCQLQHILIPGHNHYFASGCIRFPGDTADNVIGLITADFKLRHTEIAQQILQHRELLGQLGRSLLAAAFIILITFMPERNLPRIKCHDQMAWFIIIN